MAQVNSYQHCKNRGVLGFLDYSTVIDNTRGVPHHTKISSVEQVKLIHVQGYILIRMCQIFQKVLTSTFFFRPSTFLGLYFQLNLCTLPLFFKQNAPFLAQ